VTGLGLETGSGLGAGTVSGTGTGADNVNSREVESKLRIVQVILAANVVLVLGLFVWLYQLNHQLGETRDELKVMHGQAQDAMKDLTPQLDARMGVFERRMDSMDTKMQAAEDHMVNRMNTEIPAMLDKYIDKKLAEKMAKP
jgi:Tfp pilus assembly protein PilO